MKQLSSVELILLVLVSGKELSGRTVAKHYQDELGKKISYGTLYTTFRRLKEHGLVALRHGSDDDGRIRYYKITDDGRTAIKESVELHSRIARIAKGLCHAFEL